MDKIRSVVRAFYCNTLLRCIYFFIMSSNILSPTHNAHNKNYDRRTFMREHKKGLAVVFGTLIDSGLRVSFVFYKLPYV